MQTAAVIGHPIGHSLSPAIHTYWLKELNIDGQYRAHDVAPDALAEAIKKYADEGYVGLNVTLPHKESVVPLCDHLSDAALAVGAVNTIVFANNKIYGDNTDVTGFADHLLATTHEQIFHSAIILGAGGAARAVAFALKNLGVQDFTILNRDVVRAEKLIADLVLSGTAAGLTAQYEGADILVNCTSLGMTGQPQLTCDLSPLDKKAVVADIVYKPLETELLKNAQKRGLKTVDGLGMLIHQAATAFEQFYGAEAGEMVKLRQLLEHKIIMKLIGLTGSIGVGKSAAVKFMRAQGIAVHDADAAVHEIYAQSETLAWLSENFPDAVVAGQMDKEKLAKIIFENPAALKKLENYIHPRVAAHRAEFMKSATARGEKIVVCDIPLLFETGVQHEFDEVWLITAPDDMRIARTMTRFGMTAEKFNAINAMQMPQAEKEKLATRVIENNGTLEQLYEKLACLIGQI